MQDDSNSSVFMQEHASMEKVNVEPKKAQAQKVETPGLP